MYRSEDFLPIRAEFDLNLSDNFIELNKSVSTTRHHFRHQSLLFSFIFGTSLSIHFLGGGFVSGRTIQPLYFRISWSCPAKPLSSSEAVVQRSCYQNS